MWRVGALRLIPLRNPGYWELERWLVPLIEAYAHCQNLKKGHFDWCGMCACVRVAPGLARKHHA